VKTFDIEQRALDFACRVDGLAKRLARKRVVRRQSLDQLANAASAIGASLEEARGAHKGADFHSKVRISLKEARESKYWLSYVARTSGLPQALFEPIIQEAGEIVAILTTIAKNANPSG
jgi:four helix bundle protein